MIELQWVYRPKGNMPDVAGVAAIVGPRGLGIASSAWNATTGILTITYTDATVETLDLSGTFTARDAAIAAQAGAEAAQTGAETAETNAETSETNAVASANAAATSETNAAASEAAAAASAVTATQDLAALASSVTESQAARDASQAARDTTLGYRDAAAASATAGAQSATVATAAAQALIGTEGIIPTASEILWLASKSQAGVNALGFFDTGARLLSGVSERALLRYGEDNETLNFLLDFPAVDGFRLDFTQDDAVFSDTAGTTPALAGDSLARVDDQSGNDLNSVQGSAALRGKYGKTPLVIRNQALSSDNMSVLPWVRSSVSVIGTEKIISNVGLSGFLQLPYLVNNSGFLETFSAKAKADGARYLNLGRGGAGVWFDLQNGTMPFSAPGYTGAISGPDAGGYRRISVSRTEAELQNGAPTQVRLYPSINAPTSAFVGSGGGNDGVGGVLVKEVQRERGPLSPYQRVGASNLDVTESGVQAFGFYRLDLSDDVLSITVPAITGDIVIAGRSGIHIAAITLNAGAFSIGPTTYTGGPSGVLASVGDICGIEVFDKTLSASEIERITRYYQARGAGELIE